ncbi:MAG TPA: hypothetical protein VNT79_12000 [Phycisphaerae bacterium]|nr:hypothetical protein [Phycisphaerae bacterium]
MKPFKILGLALGVAALAMIGAPVQADIEHCPTHSMGAGTTTPGPSFHNVGQSVIGISSGATVVAYQGSLHCLRVHTTCILGDVNGDFLVDGADVQGYTDVTITGTGTPRELCAASIDVLTFVGLLINP